MKRRISSFTTVTALLMLGLFMGLVRADGTETLGAPSIAIGSGSGMVAGGIGLSTAQPGIITVNVPAGAAVNQVLLYWHGVTNPPSDTATPDDTIVVDGVVVPGALIGGPTFIPGANTQIWTYRADITAMNKVSAGVNNLTVEGLSFDRSNDGAGVLVIFDDGSGSSAIGVKDGNDFAHSPRNAPLDTTAPQTFAFGSADSARTAQLLLFLANVDSSGRPNALDITIDGVTNKIVNPFFSSDGVFWDTTKLDVEIPAGAEELTVQALSEDDGTGQPPASLVWVTAALSVPEPPPASAGFIIIDEDSIDNNITYWLANVIPNQNNGEEFSDTDLNEDKPAIGQRDVLRFFENNIGEMIQLQTGEVGDEAWFAPRTIPGPWANAGPTNDGLCNFLATCENFPTPGTPGPGLGSGGDPEALLDKIPDVTPLRATGLEALEGGIFCAVVWDSDISINYDPLDGSLKGENLGIVAFEVKIDGVNKLNDFSSSSLPSAAITILDADQVCAGPLELVEAPKPPSSSEPFDIDPDDPTGGYLQ